MNEAEPHDSTTAHELAVVIRGVVVRMFVRMDETCWISAASIARLIGADPVALCAECALSDLSWTASRYDNIEPRQEVRIPIPVISAQGVHEMMSRYQVLADISGEMNVEVFGVLHAKVMAMREAAEAASANARSMQALQALAAILASRTCQEVRTSGDPELIAAVDSANVLFANLGNMLEGGAR